MPQKPRSRPPRPGSVFPPPLRVTPAPRASPRPPPPPIRAKHTPLARIRACILQAPLPSLSWAVLRKPLPRALLAPPGTHTRSLGSVGRKTRAVEETLPLGLRDEQSRRNPARGRGAGQLRVPRWSRGDGSVPFPPRFPGSPLPDGRAGPHCWDS